ncbi:plasma membrane iron permease [[Candida] railenensis]|uniref:Plasma membrane iron permease n=1 Tax=[Candida] railenensis TaxID=45579 RepID=A0A9P0VW07_9ASCO|nr:plasma membrane iron permease [[Candida] railenensis]
MVNVFSPEVFFIVFRETLEAVIVISVLLAFLKKGLGGSENDPAVYKRLKRQVWWGSLTGLIICLIIGGAFIGTFYSLGKDIWSNSEDLWEGIFCVIATILISIMGVAMLRVNKMQEKWRVKLAKALLTPPKEKKDRYKIGYLTKKYCMFILPFITVLREGLEAVVFVGGVGLTSPATAFPIPVITGLLAGGLVGYLLYVGGTTQSLQIFLIFSTCILYLIAAGLFSRAIWYFQMYVFSKKTGGDAAENGSGPGTYNIHQIVWHVNCCNPETDNGWDVFNALLGWQNSATYGSVLSYVIYWIALIVVLFLMLFEEKHGHLPFTKDFTLRKLNPMYHIKNKKKNELTKSEQDALFAKLQTQKIGVEDEPEVELERVSTGAKK